MDSSPALPSDLSFEILTRASLDTLGRCRLVSKEWNCTTYDSTFLNLLCERTKTTSGVFLQSLQRNKYSSAFVSSCFDQQLSLSFLPCPVKIEASHRGILSCVSQNDDYQRPPQYYVCKPTTREWEQIYNPKTKYMTVAISIMVLRSKPFKYKIVRFSQPKCSINNLRCEVLDSEPRVWRELNDVSLPHCVFFDFKPAVLACGASHWLLSDNRVFAFHGDKETWVIFELPFSTSSMNHLLVEYQGHLAWIYEEGEELHELWVMEDYNNKVWTKRRVIEINGLDHCCSLGALCNNDVALMKGFNEIVFYKFEDCSAKITKPDRFFRPDDIFMLQSDLEPVNLRGPIKAPVTTRWFRRTKRWFRRTKHRLKIVWNYCSERVCHTICDFNLRFGVTNNIRMTYVLALWTDVPRWLTIPKLCTGRIRFSVSWFATCLLLVTLFCYSLDW